MKNILKKILSFTLALSLILAVSTTASAASGDALISKKTINEYTVYQHIQSSSVQSLKAEGYSDSEIKTGKTMDYKKALEDRAKLSSSVLKGMGYTQSQIATLRTFNGNETAQQLATVSPMLTVAFWAGSQHGHNSISSWAVYNMTWAWTVVPMFISVDTAAFSWSENFYLDEASSYTFSRVNMYNVANNTMTNTVYQTVTPHLSVGASSQFYMGQLFYVSGIPYAGEWAKTGAMSIKIAKLANVPEIAVECSYGHNTVSIAPSVSIGVPFSAGITFSFGVVDYFHDYIYSVL